MSERRNERERMTEVNRAPAEVADDSDAPPQRKRSGTRQTIEWVLLIVGALAVALLIKAFLFQAFYIPSESMVPTLNKNDRVLVNKLSYKLHDVHRGDIVVFTAPPGEDSSIKDLVKRVIGLPGDKVAFRDGTVYVNDKPLDEDYLPEGVVTTPICGVEPEVTVPPDNYWVMGDNRTASSDSRCFGPIPEGHIVGRAFFKMWPLTDLGFL
jgi:signal peptidase I